MYAQIWLRGPPNVHNLEGTRPQIIGEFLEAVIYVDIDACLVFMIERTFPQQHLPDETCLRSPRLRQSNGRTITCDDSVTPFWPMRCNTLGMIRDWRAWVESYARM